MDSSESALVSIIMPVFNSAEYLGEAIDSILFQTHSKFELIIIYDESEDDSLEIIDNYRSRDLRITVCNGNRQGIVGALNIGIDHSKGEFIARMDSDDVCEPLRLEKQIHFLKDNDLDICGGHSLLIDKSGRTDGISISPLNHDTCTLCLGFDVPFFHPTVMFKSSFLLEHNLRYGQSVYKAAEDFDLWIRMHRNGARFGSVDAVLLRYRVLDNSLSRNNRAMLRDSKALANEFFKKNYAFSLRQVTLISRFGNSFEKALVVRFIWRIVFKKGKLSAVKNLKFISSKIFIHATLSEIVRTFRYRG